MTDREKLLADVKQELRDYCQSIGCSGIAPVCPGSPKCEIVRKVMNWLKDAPPKLIKALE